MRRGIAAAAAVLGIGLLTAAPATAETAHLGYVVYFGVLPALDVTTTVESGEGRYHLTATVVPQSWVSWAIPWTATSDASGRLAADGTVIPEHYLSSATWGTRHRQTRIDFNADGSLSAGVEPPKVEEDREPVPEALLKGVLDPVSTVVAMLAAARTGGPGCAANLPVYDGRRRFDIRGERQPDAAVPAVSYSAYAGPAVVCQLHFTSIAGGYKNGERSRFWQTDKPGAERPPLELKLAPLKEGQLPVPVAAAGKSMLGWVTAYLSSYHLD